MEADRQSVCHGRGHVVAGGRLVLPGRPVGRAEGHGATGQVLDLQVTLGGHDHSHHVLPHVDGLGVKVAIRGVRVQPQALDALLHGALLPLDERSQGFTAGGLQELFHRNLPGDVALKTDGVRPTNNGVLHRQHEDLADEQPPGLGAIQRQRKTDMLPLLCHDLPALLNNLLRVDTDRGPHVGGGEPAGSAGFLDVGARDALRSDQRPALLADALGRVVAEEVHEAAAGVPDREALSHAIA
mmetsp:Transcript_86185/g.257256  ORF Transcript_86185/g.257256 Transcript_86185/m.257256 type:complete len:241 (-) Transcript_86185:196-918(-)